MTILFGHPTGNPNAHHAALAHYEARTLEAWCVPWMPQPWQLAIARRLPGLAAEARRLERRRFPPLAGAPRVEGRRQEWWRMARRVLSTTDERLSYEANDWLMATLERLCARPGVTAVHAYEDCSLWAFEEARRRDQACIYDLPIGYHPEWETRSATLRRAYGDWMNGPSDEPYVRREQKQREMRLADVVLAPSTFVAQTVRAHTAKPIVLCPYGVDSGFWHPAPAAEPHATLRFVYAGACSLRKGTPLLLEAWSAARLPDARLELVGQWQLAAQRRLQLPQDVIHRPPTSAAELRTCLQASDVFVFPSYFEGYGLVILEALACGLPVIATDATAGPDVLDEDRGRLVPAGDRDALVEVLRWFGAHRERLPAMRRAARAHAERLTWARYRAAVRAAVAPYVGGHA